MKRFALVLLLSVSVAVFLWRKASPPGAAIPPTPQLAFEPVPPSTSSAVPFSAEHGAASQQKAYHEGFASTALAAAAELEQSVVSLKAQKAPEATVRALQERITQLKAQAEAHREDRQ